MFYHQGKAYRKDLIFSVSEPKYCKGDAISRESWFLNVEFINGKKLSFHYNFEKFANEAYENIRKYLHRLTEEKIQ